MTATYSIYMKGHRSNIFGSKDFHSEAFYGSHFKIDRPARSTKQVKGHFGQWVWTYANEDASGDDVRDAVAALIRKTGLRRHLAIAVPERSNLRFASVSTRMNVSEDQTLNLVREGVELGPNGLAARRQKLVSEYFAAGSDSNDICSEVSAPRGLDSSRRTAHRVYVDVRTCARSYLKETVSAAEEMYKHLVQMKQALSAGKSEQFAQAYARLGKLMLKNQFTFQIVLGLSGAGVDLDFTIKGTHISYHLQTLQSTGRAGEFLSVRRPALDASRVGHGIPTVDQGVILTPGWPGLNP